MSKGQFEKLESGEFNVQMYYLTRGGNILRYLSKINIELLEIYVRQTFSDFSNILKGFKED